MNKNEILIFEDLIRNKSWRELRLKLEDMDAFLISELIEELSDEDDIIVFRLLPRDLAKDTFQHLDTEKQEQIIESLANNNRRLANLLNDLEPDDRTAFFEELPQSISQKLIQMLSPKEKSIALTLLGYPENSIGRLMTPEYVVIRPHYTVEHALSHIRKFGRDSETLNIIYIVDDNWKLIDDIRIREIILSDPNQLIMDLMDNRFVSLNAYDDQEVAVRVFQEQDRAALPVTDSEGKLIGIVTFDDVMDVAEEESTEDFHKFGSVQSTVVNPLRAGVFHLYSKRIGWLFALVFINIFSGAIISHYENVIQAAVALIFFLPLLIASSGNAGSQSATLMIRSIAIGDVTNKDWFKLLGKEFTVSLLLGVSMAIGVGLIANFRSPHIVWVVAITMVLVVIVGSLIGMLLPFIFTKFKADPAAASAPLVTSISDILGVLIYFAMASWILGF
ncbi:MAG: magnesium transporter [Bacteroidales bacterium]|nr:magnesium transporter [Bacteroidales bacterium]